MTLHRQTHPGLDVPDKRCPACGATKPIAEFRPNRAMRDGRNSYCKPCHVAQVADWKRRNPEKVAAARERERAKAPAAARRRKYGVTEEVFAELLATQAGRCAICDTTTPGGRGWAVDHHHGSGRVRGILCPNCNAGLGMFRDDPGVLRQAADYLEATR